MPRVGHDCTASFDVLCKLLLIGDSGTGKSSLLCRFADDEFSKDHIATIGVDFKIRTITLDDGRVAKLQIWDTAGQERFRTVTKSYYRGAQGVIVCFDVTNRESFDNVLAWLDEVERLAPSTAVPVIVGNKCDLLSERVVATKTARDLAARRGLRYVETSAKTDFNVFDTFKSLATALQQNRQPPSSSSKGLEMKKTITLRSGKKIEDHTSGSGGRWCC